MSRKEFTKRQARIAAGLCPRCGKPVDTWPLVRPDNCGGGVFTCLRAWSDIIKAESRIVVKEG
jgi:hypothetical protein